MEVVKKLVGKKKEKFSGKPSPREHFIENEVTVHESDFAGG